MIAPLAARRALWLLGGYTAASVVAYAASDYYLEILMPAIGAIVDALLPDGVVRTALGVTVKGSQELVALDAALTEPLRVGGIIVPAGEAIDATTLVAYALQPIALVYAVLAAWPTGGAPARATLLALGLPAVMLATLLDIPFVLAGLVHNVLLDAGVTDGTSRTLAIYYEFLHRGGRLGLAIAVAIGVCLACCARQRAATAS